MTKEQLKIDIYAFIFTIIVGLIPIIIVLRDAHEFIDGHQSYLGTVAMIMFWVVMIPVLGFNIVLYWKRLKMWRKKKKK